MTRKSVTSNAVPNARIRFVKISADRGYGSEPFQIVGEDDKHYTLKPATGGKNFKIYKSLTYGDKDCIKKVNELRAAQITKNRQIGIR